MAQSLFPLRETEADPEQDTTVVSLSDSAAVIEALTSRTARRILSTLQDEPLPPSEIADRAGTSIQNVTHHLDQLEAAGLVEVVDSRYSSRGHTMDVYAPVAESVLICLGPDDSADRLSQLADSELQGPAPAGSS